MRRLLVCSEGDAPSVNMRDSLLSLAKWEDLGGSGGDRFFARGDSAIMSSPDLHIYMDDPDARAEAMGLRVDEVVFMSRHSSASGEPSLTVHPIGNYGENRFGGRAGELVPAAPSPMTSALRSIARRAPPGFRVCFEATHHGPSLSKPTYFIEIGSDERTWGDKIAAEALARVLLEDADEGYPAVIGVGGGHYAPRFTEIALGFGASFGHMVPGYQMEGRQDGEIEAMIRSAMAASGTRLAYIHRGSMGRREEERLAGIAESAGAEAVTSSDLEPLPGNPRRSP
ncbi:MAG: D-aminoacyl-tRNA deacylase [Candidatus Methanoplasma sp.]|jgi:D-aminoacyl-tRNA deacylase|nr:D-aminoacyl-tRNA deacylase [Candidatus Methanoplasma sp.]